MVTERPDAVKSYQPLPIHEAHKKNSALPAINVQMAQLSRQLTQLIDQMQRLNHQMQKENKIPESSDISQTTIGINAKNQDNLIKKDKSTEIKLEVLGKRRGFSKFINGVFMFFWVIGIAAALFAAIVLFFHGPAMI